MSARPVEIRVRLTSKQAEIFKNIAAVVGVNAGDALAAFACAHVASINDHAEADTLEAFSAVRTFIYQKKTPLYPTAGLTDFIFETQEDRVQ